MESFQRVAPQTYLREAPKEPSISYGGVSSNEKMLVVICSWVEASKRHIDKYADTYADQYPNASILVVRTSVASCILKASDKSQQKRLEPARRVINESTSPIFFHVISNGGTVAASQVLMMLEPPRRSAIRAMVLDCCPGKATWRRTAHAFAATAPKPLRPVLAAVVYPTLAVPALLSKMGMTNVISRARPRLVDQDLIRHDIPRLYVYSQTDAMIYWKDVRDHADDARVAGYRHVKEVKFTKGQHCALIKQEPEKYWGEIRDLLQSVEIQVTPGRAESEGNSFPFPQQ